MRYIVNFDIGYSWREWIRYAAVNGLGMLINAVRVHRSSLHAEEHLLVSHVRMLDATPFFTIQRKDYMIFLGDNAVRVPAAHIVIIEGCLLLLVVRIPVVRCLNARTIDAPLSEINLWRPAFCLWPEKKA